MNILNKEIIESYIKNNKKSTLFPILADIYFYENQLEKAEKICNEGLKHHPDSPVGYYILGLLAYEKDDIPKAIMNFKFCIKKCPVYLKAYDKLLMVGKEHLSIQDLEFYYQQIKQIESDIKFPELKKEKQKVDVIETKEPEPISQSEPETEKFDNIPDMIKNATETNEQIVPNFSEDIVDEELVIDQSGEEIIFTEKNAEVQKNQVISEQPVSMELEIESDETEELNIFDEAFVDDDKEEDFLITDNVQSEFIENTNTNKTEPFLDEESSQQIESLNLKELPQEDLVTNNFDVIKEEKMEIETSELQEDEIQPPDIQTKSNDQKLDKIFSSLNESDIEEDGNFFAFNNTNSLSIQPVDDFEDEIITNDSEPVPQPEPEPEPKLTPKQKNKTEEKVELKIPIPTMTFVEVLKKQALYDQALEILDMLEKRPHDKEKISLQREEIYKLKAQDAVK